MLKKARLLTHPTRRLFHPPALSLPRQTRRPGTRLVAGKAAARRANSYPLGYVEGLNDARTTLADFFSIPLDPWVHPFRAVLRQLLIVAPQVGMVVVELGQEIVQF